MIYNDPTTNYIQGTQHNIIVRGAGLLIATGMEGNGSQDETKSHGSTKVDITQLK